MKKTHLILEVFAFFILRAFFETVNCRLSEAHSSREGKGPVHQGKRKVVVAIIKPLQPRACKEGKGAG